MAVWNCQTAFIKLSNFHRHAYYEITHQKDRPFNVAPEKSIRIAKENKKQPFLATGGGGEKKDRANLQSMNVTLMGTNEHLRREARNVRLNKISHEILKIFSFKEVVVTNGIHKELKYCPSLFPAATCERATRLTEETDGRRAKACAGIARFWMKSVNSTSRGETSRVVINYIKTASKYLVTRV